MLIYARTTQLLPSFLLVLLGGALVFYLLVQDATIVQQEVPAGYRGRVFGARLPMRALGYLGATSTIMILSSRSTPQELMRGASWLYGGAVLLCTLLLPGAWTLLRMGRAEDGHP